MQLSNRRLGPTENNVEIVNHKIEDDINVEGSGSENAEPVHLKKKRLTKNGANCPNRRIETFEVTDLKDAIAPLREIYQSICLLKGRGEGFFH